MNQEQTKAIKNVLTSIHELILSSIDEKEDPTPFFENYKMLLAKAHHSNTGEILPFANEFLNKKL